jgi:hypothetical protein
VSASPRGAVPYREHPTGAQNRVLCDQPHERKYDDLYAVTGSPVDVLCARSVHSGVSVEPKGQRVTTPICSIFRFDEDGRIVFEEMYEDALAVMQQLGAVPA